MLALGGKERVRADATNVISSLGYSTTGFYFYNTLPGRSYEDTILAVHEYAKREGLPYKHYLLDSFWYGQYTNGCLNSTIPKPNCYSGAIHKNS
eukprot:gene1877-1045_t